VLGYHESLILQQNTKHLQTPSYLYSHVYKIPPLKRLTFPSDTVPFILVEGFNLVRYTRGIRGSTYNFSIFIACINGQWHRRNTGDSRIGVGAIFGPLVHMVEAFD
jgi:hypothetical protein